MSAVQKGWIATGLYCAIAITPGVNLIPAFLLAWAALVTFAPALGLIQAVLSLVFGSSPDWIAAWIALAVFAALLILPTLRAAWRSAPFGRRVLAVAQTAAMWVIGIASSLLAARALGHIG